VCAVYTDEQVFGKAAPRPIDGDLQVASISRPPLLGGGKTRWGAAQAGARALDDAGGPVAREKMRRLRGRRFDYLWHSADRRLERDPDRRTTRRTSPHLGRCCRR